MDLSAKLVHPDLNNDALGCNQFLISVNFITDDIQENHAKIIPKRPFFLHAPKKVTNGANNSEMVTSSPYVVYPLPHDIGTVAINLHVDLVYPDLWSYAYKPQAKLISCFSLVLAPALVLQTPAQLLPSNSRRAH